MLVRESLLVVSWNERKDEMEEEEATYVVLNAVAFVHSACVGV